MEDKPKEPGQPGATPPNQPPANVPGAPQPTPPAGTPPVGGPPQGDHSRFMPGSAPGGQPAPASQPAPVRTPAPAPAPTPAPAPSHAPPVAAAPQPAAAPKPAAVKRNRVDLDSLRVAVDKIKAELRTIIVGQHQMIEQLVIAILADGHVLIEGVPGVAKTLTSKLLSRTISVDFKRIQFTPDLMPSDVIGTSIFNQRANEFEFKKGPIFSNIVLIDEINRAPAKTQAALFESMEERQVTVDGTTYTLDVPFMVMATQNPVEQEGTYRLPEAQLDRFLFKIEVTYPALHEEQQLLVNYHEKGNKVDLNDVKPVLSAEQIAEFRKKIGLVHIDANLINYIAAIVHQTRDNMSLFLGASPRASISILTASKAAAAIRGRDYVTPDDIKFIANAVLKHRIVLTPEKEMEGVSPDEVIRQIIETVEVPR